MAFINGSHFVVPPTNGCFNSINIIAGIRSTINLVQTVANSSCLAGYFPSNMEDNGCRSNLRFFLILFYFPECDFACATCTNGTPQCTNCNSGYTYNSTGNYCGLSLPNITDVQMGTKITNTTSINKFSLN